MRDGVDRRGVIRRWSSPIKQERAKEYRKSPTPAEAKLWECLRANRLNNLHFRRQHILDGYIVDFYCHKTALVVEVDGPIHDAQREKDEFRDEHLAYRGIRTLRVKNEEVMSRLEDVCRRITEACDR